MSEAIAERFDLSRFVRAQAGIYPRALAELREGHKRSHWMWFVFPQVKGLGSSKNSRFFGISGREEARAFLDHELLGARLAECTDIMLGWVGRRGALQVFGPIDGLKFHSSMTLFEAVSGGDTRYAEALDAFFGGKRDTATLERL